MACLYKNSYIYKKHRNLNAWQYSEHTSSFNHFHVCLALSVLPNFKEECVKVPKPAHQVLPLTTYIFDVIYSTPATRVNKI